MTANSKNTLLWLHGTQGSGKSCLTSTVIDEIMKASQSNDMHSLAYFYCSRDTAEPERAKPQSILACIARQLSRRSQTQSIAPPTLALYYKLHSVDGSKRKPTMAELCSLIRELTELYDRSMIVVDALDECDVVTRWELVEALESITESASLVKIFVSSREEGDLRLSLQTHSGLQVTSLENEDDIRKFVEFETDRLIAKKQLLAYIRKKQTKEELTQLIKEDVISKAKGMFRWAELQLQSLRGIRAEKDIRSELFRIPRDLSALYQDLYDKALETTQETDQIVFQHTLKWMLSAQQNLTHHDFFLAITAFTDLGADDLDEDFILDLLSNFVVSSTTEEGDRFFRFAHLSVREFLEEMPEYSTEWTNTFAAEVALLTLICASDSPSANEFINTLGVVPLDIVPFSEIRSNEQGFHDYSLKFWTNHCVLAGEQNRATENLNIRKLLHFFLFDDSDDNCPLNCWALSLRRDESLGIIMKNYQSPHDRAFLLACYSGFDEIVHIALDHGLDERVKEEGALSAFKQAHASTAELLIGPRGDAKLREYVLHHLGAPHRTAEYADADVVRWLLDLVEPAQITEKVILNAKNLDAEVICMLLDHNRDLRITENMIRKCLLSRGAIMAFVTREPDIEILPDMLIAVIRTWPFDAKLCINLINRAGPASINCDVISWIAYSAGDPEREEQAMPILLLLLERAGPLNISHRAVTRAFVNDNTGKVVKILLDHGWPVTPQLIREAASFGNPAVFPLIFNAAGGSCDVTPELLQATVESYETNGHEILRYLVSRSSQPISDETWARLISYCLTPETLRCLLDMKPNMRVPESVLLHITQENIYTSDATLSMLLKDARDLEITDAVVGSALEKMEYGEHVSQLLNRHDTELITQPLLIGAVSNVGFGDEMTGALIHRNVPMEAPSTEVINAVIKNTHSGLQYLRMLEAHFGPIKFTDEHIETAASGSLQMIKLVFDRRSVTHVTPSMLLRAASRGTLDGMKFLLQLDDAIVTREILIIAAGNGRCGAKMLRLLWDHSPDIKPCVEMFMKSASITDTASGTIGFLVDRLDDIQLAQEVLETAIRTRYKYPFGASRVVEALLGSTLPVKMTGEMVTEVRGDRDMNPFMCRVVDRYAGATETQEMADL
ncbi:hypothetical protein PMG11_09927 [Penicillium brasilianum]|uniref:Nephrocystin 3-like N-terminal domain-containing protein n=1 Tax=Penicillium brasilianum TaxID=104259 RepID=A0A0F7U258_PENBI|nr:hypothetical protein PMG11_09927 [Penicillium brasilianum]